MTHFLDRRHLCTFVAVLLLTVVPVPGLDAAEAAEDAAPDCPDRFARVDVTVDPEQEPLQVEPESVTVYRKGADKAHQVCWVVAGLGQGQTLHIRRKEGQEDLFPNLERTVAPPRDTAKSGLPAAIGTWRYDLWITVEGSDEKLHLTDPEVIIQDGGN